MDNLVFGPDGKPAVFEGGVWISADRRHRWNGSVWVPVSSSGASPWLMRLGIWVLFAALVGYVVFTLFTTTSAYTAGFYVGVLAFFAVLFVVFRFVGRWGCLGIGIRVILVGLALLKILSLIAHPPPTP